MREKKAGHTGHHERVGKPRQRCHQNGQHDCRDEMLDHLIFLQADCLSSSKLFSSKVNRADREVDEIDANERNDDPAKPIDKKITPQDTCRADGPIGHPAQRQGD
jgi:hypothetical protein